LQAQQEHSPAQRPAAIGESRQFVGQDHQPRRPFAGHGLLMLAVYRQSVFA